MSGEIDQFLLITRLLHAGTSESMYEVQGETSFVRQVDPTLLSFRFGDGLLGSTRLIRRVVRLNREDDLRIRGLRQRITEAEKARPGMIVTSFGMALHKFQASHHSHTWWERIADLATAFEAALSGSDPSDVVLRLKTHSAALLATERDPASAIFNDVGLLYRLRSRLVHGGELRETQLKKIVLSISTVPDDAPFGVAVDHAVDRFADLVRRSLLARICLAADEEGEPSTWPLGTDGGVDENLADDATRRVWRSK